MRWMRTKKKLNRCCCCFIFFALIVLFLNFFFIFSNMKSKPSSFLIVMQITAAAFNHSFNKVLSSNACLNRVLDRLDWKLFASLSNFMFWKYFFKKSIMQFVCSFKCNWLWNQREKKTLNNIYGKGLLLRFNKSFYFMRFSFA